MRGMKSCKQCDEYDVCSRQNDLRRKKPRCPKAKIDKPITNYDRLVSKTPEELAEWIGKETIFCCDRDRDCRYEPCEPCLLRWLKSPVEVET